MSTVTKPPLPPNNTNREQVQKQRKPGVQNQSRATKMFATHRPPGPLPVAAALNSRCWFLCYFLAPWTSWCRAAGLSCYHILGQGGEKRLHRAPKMAALTPPVSARACGPVIVKFALKQFRIVKCSFLEAAPEKAFRKKEKASALCCLCLEKQPS